MTRFSWCWVVSTHSSLSLSWWVSSNLISWNNNHCCSDLEENTGIGDWRNISYLQLSFMFSSLKKQGVENLKKLVKTFGLFLICVKELIITLPYFYRSFLTFQVLTNQVNVNCHFCNIEFVVAGCIFHPGRESVVSTRYFHITLFTLALHCYDVCEAVSGGILNIHFNI